MDKTRSDLKIQSKQLKSLEMQVGKMAKILSTQQQMSLPTLEEPKRVQTNAMELRELVVKEEGSTSLGPNGTRK